MKQTIQTSIRIFRKYAYLLGFLILLIGCETGTTDKKKDIVEEEVPKFEEVIWHIRAVHPDGKTFNVKAIDEDGNTFDVNAIQNSDQDSFLDIKAFIGDKQLPIKMLVSNSKYAPVKAIDKGGVSYDIKAIADDGEKLFIKGVLRYGNTVSLRAVNKTGKLYAVKAISPTGKLNDVKGIKINFKEKEMTLNGFNVYAHIKAMHQSVDENLVKERSKVKSKGTSKKEVVVAPEIIKWNIKAITLEGQNLDIKAVDAEGNLFDINAIQDSDQFSFMDIKAFVGDYVLPVKVLVSEDKYSPVKAISRDGTLYDIKAITPEGTKLDVKGISRLGTIIDIKAINENGDFYGVKAFSPEGKLNDIKGIKIFQRDKELSIRGNNVYAHVKAITQ